MIQILCGDDGHSLRCAALSSSNPGSSVAKASDPAVKKAQSIDTLVIWGHGDASSFCKMTSAQMLAKIKEWVKLNPSIKTLEIITCNSRHGTENKVKQEDGTIEVSWVKSYTDQLKPGLKKLGLTVKALPMGMGGAGAHKWSVLKYNTTTNTWLYVTADGAKDTDMMWPGVLRVEEDPIFVSTKNYATAGAAAKAKETMRKYTLDFGTIGELRGALVKLA